MSAEQILQIPLDTIQASEGNRRVGGFDPAKLEQLADSIRAVGVQQPAVVRIHPDGYELVAGERRWRAARLAGLETLPCVVRELDDVQVLKIQTIENLQREDIHPLDEADGYARLIQRAGYDVEHLAQEVGRSASYVYQRLKLKDLVPEARKLLVDGTIQAGHAILIARLQMPEQKQLLDWMKHRYQGETLSVNVLDEYIHRTILLDLSKAPFKRDDAQLIPEAGPCTDCPKRSGYQPALFADMCNGKRDYCTDPGCFQGKLAALVERRRKELVVFPHLQVSTSWGRSGREEEQLQKTGVMLREQWEECKKSEEGAVRCLVVDGEDRGRLTWGRERKKGRAGRYEPTAEEKKAREKENRERLIRAAVTRGLWDGVMEKLQSEGVYRVGLPLEVLRLVALHLWERTRDNHRALYCKTMGWQPPAKKKGEYGNLWEGYGMREIRGMTLEGLSHFLVTCSLIGDLDTLGYNHDEPVQLKQIAGILGLDATAMAAEAKEKAQVLGKTAARARPKGAAK